MRGEAALPPLERIARVSLAHGRALAEALERALACDEFADVAAVRALRALASELRIDLGEVAVN